MPKRATGTSKAASSTKSTRARSGGGAIRKAQEWGGGSKGAKGAVTRSDKRNRNSSAKS